MVVREKLTPTEEKLTRPQDVWFPGTSGTVSPLPLHRTKLPPEYALSAVPASSSSPTNMNQLTTSPSSGTLKLNNL